MQGRENFIADTSTTLSERHGYRISRTTLCLLLLFFLLSLIGVGFLVYNFVACPAGTNNNKNETDRSELCGFNEKINTNDGNIIENKTDSDDNNQNNDSDESNKKIDKNIVDVRLPRSVIPISYNIKLIPFMIEDNFTFSGDVKILVKIVKNTFNITMHSESLLIQEIKLINNYMNEEDNRFTGNSLNNYTFDSARQFLILEFKDELQNGTELIINIKFRGILNDYLQGFYRSSYAVGNETRWVATTQFQPTDARRAFPCFDEPALKAKFNLTIARPKNMTSISNMPRIGEPKPVDGLADYEWDTYQESVPMSTYLVAFVVSDFVNRTSGNIAVWARTDAIRSAAYALSVAPRMLKFLETFFDLKFPLPKIDMIALPDFSAGAMENWGLITYRETAMLYDDGVSAQSNKQRVATVVAHELAHQWFGNLVTPSWWSDLWLNEGFASYMEYLGVDAVEPSWKSMDQFVVNELQNVFSLDALSSSHQISVEVHNPDEINEIFDRISYGKGAAIIRMMDHFLTTKVFQSGLTNYLKNKAYESADQDDLWHYLTEAARQHGVFDNQTTVKIIMDTWTLLTGFPVLNVIRDYKTRSITLSQNRFMYLDSSITETNVKDATSASYWWIPITYTTMMDLNFNNTRPTHWLRGEEKQVLSNIDVSNLHWIIMNIQQTGYYRVNYDQTNWNLIITHLNNERHYHKISPANRAQIIDDSLNLARGGYLSYNTAMDITRYLKHETDYVPWKAAISALNFIDSMLITSSDYHKFKTYFLQLLENVYKEVGFEDTNIKQMLTVYKRVDILTAACHLGYKDCIARSIQQYHLWMHEGNPDNNNPISPNLKTVVYCTAIKYGDQMEWDFAWERFQKTTIPSEKEILLTSLGCSRETWILTRFLERSMTDQYNIRKQDVFRVFGAVSNNVLGQPIAFNYIRNNWERMKEYLGSSMSNLNTIFKYSTKPMNTEYELDELKQFANKYKKDAGRAIQQAIETADGNLKWMNKNYKLIVDWLGNATESS